MATSRDCNAGNQMSEVLEDDCNKTTNGGFEEEDGDIKGTRLANDKFINSSKQKVYVAKGVQCTLSGYSNINHHPVSPSQNNKDALYFDCWMHRNNFLDFDRMFKAAPINADNELKLLKSFIIFPYPPPSLIETFANELDYNRQTICDWFTRKRLQNGISWSEADVSYVWSYFVKNKSSKEMTEYLHDNNPIEEAIEAATVNKEHDKTKLTIRKLFIDGNKQSVEVQTVQCPKNIDVIVYNKKALIGEVLEKMLKKNFTTSSQQKRKGKDIMKLTKPTIDQLVNNSKQEDSVIEETDKCTTSGESNINENQISPSQSNTDDGKALQPENHQQITVPSQSVLNLNEQVNSIIDMDGTTKYKNTTVDDKLEHVASRQKLNVLPSQQKRKNRYNPYNRSFHCFCCWRADRAVPVQCESYLLRTKKKHKLKTIDMDGTTEYKNNTVDDELEHVAGRQKLNALSSQQKIKGKDIMKSTKPTIDQSVNNSKQEDSVIEETDKCTTSGESNINENQSSPSGFLEAQAQALFFLLFNNSKQEDYVDKDVQCTTSGESNITENQISPSQSNTDDGKALQPENHQQQQITVPSQSVGQPSTSEGCGGTLDYSLTTKIRNGSSTQEIEAHPGKNQDKALEKVAGRNKLNALSSPQTRKCGDIMKSTRPAMDQLVNNSKQEDYVDKDVQCTTSGESNINENQISPSRNNTDDGKALQPENHQQITVPSQSVLNLNEQVNSTIYMDGTTKYKNKIVDDELEHVAGRQKLNALSSQQKRKCKDIMKSTKPTIDQLVNNNSKQEDSVIEETDKCTTSGESNITENQISPSQSNTDDGKALQPENHQQQQITVPSQSVGQPSTLRQPEGCGGTLDYSLTTKIQNGSFGSASISWVEAHPGKNQDKVLEKVAGREKLNALSSSQKRKCGDIMKSTRPAMDQLVNNSKQEDYVDKDVQCTTSGESNINENQISPSRNNTDDDKPLQPENHQQITVPSQSVLNLNEQVNSTIDMDGTTKYKNKTVDDKLEHMAGRQRLNALINKSQPLINKSQQKRKVKDIMKSTKPTIDQLVNNSKQEDSVIEETDKCTTSGESNITENQISPSQSNTDDGKALQPENHQQQQITVPSQSVGQPSTSRQPEGCGGTLYYSLPIKIRNRSSTQEIEAHPGKNQDKALEKVAGRQKLNALSSPQKRKCGDIMKSTRLAMDQLVNNSKQEDSVDKDVQCTTTGESNINENQISSSRHKVDVQDIHSLLGCMDKDLIYLTVALHKLMNEHKPLHEIKAEDQGLNPKDQLRLITNFLFFPYPKPDIVEQLAVELPKVNREYLRTWFSLKRAEYKTGINWNEAEISYAWSLRVKNKSDKDMAEYLNVNNLAEPKGAASTVEVNKKRNRGKASRIMSRKRNIVQENLSQQPGDGNINEHQTSQDGAPLLTQQQHLQHCQQVTASTRELQQQQVFSIDISKLDSHFVKYCPKGFICVLMCFCNTKHDINFDQFYLLLSLALHPFNTCEQAKLELERCHYRPNEELLPECCIQSFFYIVRMCLLPQKVKGKTTTWAMETKQFNTQNSDWSCLTNKQLTTLNRFFFDCPFSNLSPGIHMIAQRSRISLYFIRTYFHTIRCHIMLLINNNHGTYNKYGLIYNSIDPWKDSEIKKDCDRVHQLCMEYAFGQIERTKGDYFRKAFVK